MIQNYELYIILNPNLTSEAISGQVENIKQILVSELKAENLTSQEEGLRRIAYPIKGGWSGFYVLFTFDVELANCSKLKNVEKKLNLAIENIYRYLIINQTDFLKQKTKETAKPTDTINHRDLNKGKAKKKCLSRFLGLRVVDYKNTAYLSQFTSPYAKIFSTEKTGTSAKFQRKIAQAIKRARHMALIPFTPVHYN